MELFNSFFTKGLTTTVCKSDKIDYKNNGQLSLYWGINRTYGSTDTVSNKTYQKFRDKRLIRPGS